MILFSASQMNLPLLEDIAKRLLPYYTFADLLQYQLLNRCAFELLEECRYVWTAAGVAFCLTQNVEVNGMTLEQLNHQEFKKVMRELGWLWGPHGDSPVCISTLANIRYITSRAEQVNEQMAVHLGSGAQWAKTLVADFVFDFDDADIISHEPIAADWLCHSNDVNFTLDHPHRNTILSVSICFSHGKCGLAIDSSKEPPTVWATEIPSTVNVSLYTADLSLPSPFELVDIKVIVDSADEMELRSRLKYVGPWDFDSEIHHDILTQNGLRCVLSILA